MRALTIITLALCFAAAPFGVAGANDDGPGARCNGHMCPVARSATEVGYKVVSKLPLVSIDEGELLA